MTKKAKTDEQLTSIIKTLKNKVKVQEDDIQHLEKTLRTAQQIAETMQRKYDQLRQEYASHLITTIKIVRY